MSIGGGGLALYVPLGRRDSGQARTSSVLHFGTMSIARTEPVGMTDPNVHGALSLAEALTNPDPRIVSWSEWILERRTHFQSRASLAYWVESGNFRPIPTKGRYVEE